MNEYKYQISISDGKGGIYVARGEDRVQVWNDIVYYRGLVAEAQPTVQAATEPVKQTLAIPEHFCTKHDKQMKERNFNGKIWYDHRRKNGEEWEQCSGHGFGSELKTSVEESFNKSNGQEGNVDPANF
jgi:hypothetical protein